MSPEKATLAPQSVEQLEEFLSQPTQRAVDAMSRLTGDVLLLGVGGKMGPTLARMAKRASDAAGVQRRVIGVSRFSTPDVRQRMQSWGVETIAGDLFDERFIDGLPAAGNVVFMAGFKFGASANSALTWATNCYLPALTSRQFRDSRIAAFSTGNVYGLVPADGTGSVESDAPNPTGEYAMAALGRERMFEYFSQSLGIPLTLLRLNYATELRYGVLVDLALRIWNGQPIDLSMGYVNVIWQGDANAMALTSLHHAAAPPLTLNIAGSEIVRVRDVARQLADELGKPARFTGTEAPDALLSNGRAGHELLGPPVVPLSRQIAWTADWIRRGGTTLGKPTKFQSRDGKF